MDIRYCVLLTCVLAVIDHSRSGLAEIPEPCVNSKCSGGKVCFKPYGGVDSICLCPIGFTGDNCMTREFGMPDSCSFPTNAVDYCEAKGECGIAGGTCGKGKVCCAESDACTFTCITPGCSNPYDLKKCTDDNKVCNDDNSPRGFSCYCPMGFYGDQCENRFPGIDDKCDVPQIDICESFQNPTCADTSFCDGDKICCSTGCGTRCVDPPSQPQPEPPPVKGRGQFGIDSSFIQLMLLTNLAKPPPRASPRTVPRACQPICGRIFCPNNVGAVCQPINNGCDGYFYDQYNQQIITQMCPCPPNAQEHPNCGPEWCFQNGKPLTCTAFPDAHCRISKCNGCYRYWTDSKGKHVNCG
ncbi:uncharacterized protein LOC120328230 [Styela clava]